MRERSSNGVARAEFLGQARDVCAATRHALCGNSFACQDLVEVFSGSGVEPEGIGTGIGLVTNGQPTAQWTTPQLLRLVSDDLKKIHVRDRFKRDTVLTSALARLGERGLEPDAVVRTGLGDELLAAILEEAIYGRFLVMDGHCDIDDLPRGGMGRDYSPRPSP